MSTVSTQPAPPSKPEQELASLPALPEKADPGGLTERAPALLSLLPDEALSTALAGADAFAVHAALTSRLARESYGPVRDTLQELLGQHALFVMAERPPRLGSFLGTGVAFTGLPSVEKQQEGSFIATRAVCLFGMPVWPLGEHQLLRGRDGQLEVLGRVAATRGSQAVRLARVAALSGLVLAGVGLALTPFLIRQVELVNGLPRPVEVRVDDEVLTLEPGEIQKRQFYRLSTPYHVEARWLGAQQPFEELSLEASQRAVYNVLGAASLKVDDAPLTSQSLEEDGQLQWQGGWEDKVRELKASGRLNEAESLCRALFLADPTLIQAGQEAAHLLASRNRSAALEFARLSLVKFPEDAAVQRLVQDVFLALGARREAFELYEGLSRQAPASLARALHVARVAPPSEQRLAYGRVLERFPEAPEARRALARLDLADGYAKDALQRLDEVLAQAPETLEDVELRVRALAALKRFQLASGVVRQFSVDPRHGSWELALLSGRLARVAGPTRTQYVTRDLIPPSMTSSHTRMVAFSLLTGESSVSDTELKSIEDLTDRSTLELTRTLLLDFDKAVKQASTASDSVLSNLDPESAALIALELSRLGEKQAAQRVFNSSLQLMAAREPLEFFLRLGEADPAFRLLAPGLQAAAYLVRARAVPAEHSQLVDYARSADGLGGMARRALDPGYEEPAPRDESRPSRYRPRYGHHIEIIQIIKGNTGEKPEPPPPPPPPPPPRERLPRPWEAP